jgi:DNA-binding transcriptional regulator YhcF (GntR family)
MLFIDVKKENNQSYAKQIYIQIRNKILHGELKCEEKLPSTRELSKSSIYAGIRYDCI